MARTRDLTNPADIIITVLEHRRRKMALSSPTGRMVDGSAWVDAAHYQETDEYEHCAQMTKGVSSVAWRIFELMKYGYKGYTAGEQVLSRGDTPDKAVVRDHFYTAALSIVDIGWLVDMTAADVRIEIGNAYDKIIDNLLADVALSKAG